MTHVKEDRNWTPLVLAAILGAVLFGTGAVVAVGVAGGTDTMDIMGDGMSGDLDDMHEDCHRMMDEHDGNHSATART